jgi:hypothetical protein
LHNAAILQAKLRGVNALCSAPAEAIKTTGGRGSISASPRPGVFALNESVSIRG